MLHDCRTFLEKVLPWPKDDQEGFINVHTLTNGVPGMWGQAFRDIDTAMRFINRLLNNGEQVNIYTCMSRQQQAAPATSKTGWQYLKARRNQENAMALKSLYVDMDVGEAEGKYASFNEMQADFLRFLKETGLPRPSIGIKSGNGAHVHWVFTREVTVDEYYVIAHALVNAAKKHGLKIDGGVTTDTARVLRPPVTFNYKTPHEPKLVSVWFPFGEEYDYDSFKKLLEPYHVVVPCARQATTRHAFIENLALFPLRTGAQVDNSAAYSGVEQGMTAEEIKACLDAIPNDRVDWEFWNTTGMRVYAASNGEQYGLAEWQRWSATNVAATAASKDTCASRWATYHHSPPTHTGAGALVNAARAAIGNPKWVPRAQLQVTSQVKPQRHQGPTDDIPFPYERDAEGRICYLKKASKEEQEDEYIEISNYQMEGAYLLGDVSKQEKGYLVFDTWIGTERTPIAIELAQIGSQNMRSIIQEHGLMLPTGPLHGITTFMNSWVNYLQKHTIPTKHIPFGWSMDGPIYTGFVYGGRVWSASGDTPAGLSDPVLQRTFSPSSDDITGMVEIWREASKVITNQGRPELDVLIASSFAAPLVKFTGYPGVLLSCFSTNSGVGKSTALNVAQAVWGNPVRGKSSLNDTELSMVNKMGQLRNLPIYWDEIKTEEQTKRFVNITFQTTEGRERTRMTAKIAQRAPGEWYTLLVSASNASLLDFVTQHTSTTTAGLYRIFEYDIDRAPAGTPGRIIPSDAQRIVSKLNDAYGAVGMEYARYLGSNAATLEEEVSVEGRRVNKDTLAIEDERFWVATIAILLVGARVATRLGYVTLDENTMREFLYGVMNKLRGTKAEVNVDMTNKLDVRSKLQEFMNAAKSHHLLITDRVHVGIGRAPKGSVKVLSDPSRLQGVWAQLGKTDKILRIGSSQLGEWCINKGISRVTLTRAMQDVLGFQKKVLMLGAGTGIPEVTSFKDNVLEIDLTNIPELDIVDAG